MRIFEAQIRPMSSRCELKIVLFLTVWLLLSAAPAPLRAQESIRQQRVRSPRLTRVLSELSTRNQGAVQEFWQEVERNGTPLVEPIPGDPRHYWTTFLWHAKEPTTNVLLISGLSNSTYARTYLNQNLLSPLRGTDIWYRTYRVRGDARFTYELSVNDSLVPSEDEEHPDQRESRFRFDPLNPRHATGPDSESLAELPDAPGQGWLSPQSNSSKGEVYELKFKSQILSNERTIWVYTPSGYDRSTTPNRLAIFLDGDFYTSGIPVPVILDNLLAAKKIVSAIAIFIGNVADDQPAARTTELSCYPPFTEFLTRELVPWIHERYRVTSRPAETLIAGVSRGGTGAACAALEHPEVFGNVSSQSGFFVYKDRNWFKNAAPKAAPDAESQEEMAWDQYGVLMQQFASKPRLDIRFYLDVGRFENDFHPSPLIANRHLRDVLTAKGYQIKYLEFSGHHSLVNWRGTLPDALIYFFGLTGTPPLSP